MRKLASLLPVVSLLALGLFVPGCPEETETDPVPTKLQAPPEGQGFQMTTGEQPVAAGEEVQNCYFFQVKDMLAQGGLDATKPLNLNHVQIEQTEGTHHLNIFRVRTIIPDDMNGLDPAKGPYLGKNGVGACFNPGAWADWPLVANTQIDGTLDWQFPEGVANKLDPEEWLMVQSHYVNGTTQKTPDGAGEVLINFWHLPDAEVVHELGTLFATKQSIRVCRSNPNPTFSGSCQFAGDEPAQIIGANAHFHSRGKQFDMWSWDGVSTTTPSNDDKFYSSTTWDEPPMEYGAPLAEAPALGGVFYTCGFQWTEPPPAIGCEGLDKFDSEKKMTPDDQLDCCYTFGPLVDRNEHCNIFVYYYPKSADINCF